MERRINTEAIHARGIFPGARVVRGHNWEWKLLWNSDKYNMLVWEQYHCRWRFMESWWKGTYGLGHDGEVGHNLAQKTVFWKNCIKDHWITGSRIKDHWIKDHWIKDYWIKDWGFVLILPISVSGPKALCNHNCSIFPQCSKAGSKVNVGSLSLS